MPNDMAYLTFLPIKRITEREKLKEYIFKPLQEMSQTPST
jgi:hypothetical protein